MARITLDALVAIWTGVSNKRVMVLLNEVQSHDVLEPRARVAYYRGLVTKQYMESHNYYADPKAEQS